ncbi:MULTISPECIES: metallophosphoesterase family protein [Paenibacillus]|uniref:Phosphoesterase n=1 Tax=Paenibacillus lactis 154 TaxID=743719 RepID=G4HB90_9BACL|nr:metallophosphoesterase family protein [Paenibacillus lactis]EHB67199.1 phosphodiesterase, MJ0936 family [Paenibacillus lactis 154]
MSSSYQVVVVSDTHIPKRSKELPPRLVEDLKEAQLILHAGDWSSWDVYEQFSRYAPVEGVAGNTDPEEIISKLGYQKIVEVLGHRIGIVHGHGTGGTTPGRALKAFESSPVDMIVFGHSHIPYMESVQGTVLFNPGSPTDKRRLAQYSHGLIQVAEGRLDARHVFYDRT